MASTGTSSIPRNEQSEFSDSKQQTATSASGHDYNGNQRNPKYRFTAEEVRVLRECNRESFYYRAVPLSTSLMLATHYAVKMGYLKSNPRWGSALKVAAAGILGYTVGKASYHSACIKKIMQLPNSPLAEALRRKQQGFASDMLMFDKGLGMEGGYMRESDSDSSSLSEAFNLDPGSSGKWDIDTHQNVEFQGLEENQRPTTDNQIPQLEDSPPTQSFVSYDQLRKKNREEYDNRRLEYQRREASLPQVAPSRPITSAPPSIKNVYGDTME